MGEVFCGVVFIAAVIYAAVGLMEIYLGDMEDGN
jgi:hypothetical protein